MRDKSVFFFFGDTYPTQECQKEKKNERIDMRSEGVPKDAKKKKERRKENAEDVRHDTKSW